MGGITDPCFTMEQNQDSLEWQDWPEVQYPDIYTYLVATPSPYIIHLSKIPSSVSKKINCTQNGTTESQLHKALHIVVILSIVLCSTHY